MSFNTGDDFHRPWSNWTSNNDLVDITSRCEPPQETGSWKEKHFNQYYNCTKRAIVAQFLDREAPNSEGTTSRIGVRSKFIDANTGDHLWFRTKRPSETKNSLWYLTHKFRSGRFITSDTINFKTINSKSSHTGVSPAHTHRNDKNNKNNKNENFNKTALNPFWRNWNKVAASQTIERTSSRSQHEFYCNRKNNFQLAKSWYKTLQEKHIEFKNKICFQRDIALLRKERENRTGTSVLPTETDGAIKTFYSKNQTIGLSRRKSPDKMPYVIPFTCRFQHSYSSASEKERHIRLIEGFRQLREYIERNEGRSVAIIKDFLTKHCIYGIDGYTEDEILNIKRVTYTDYRWWNPVKNIKEMIYDVLNFKGEWPEMQRKVNDGNDGNEFVYVSPWIKGRKRENSYRDYTGNYGGNTGNGVIREKGRKWLDDDSVRIDLKAQSEYNKPEKDYAHHPERIVKDIGSEIHEVELNRQKAIEKLNRHFNQTAKTFFITGTALGVVNDDRANDANRDKDKDRDSTSTSMENTGWVRRHPKEAIAFQNSDNRSKQPKRNKSSWWEITQRWYYKAIEKPFGKEDFRKCRKLTEFINYNIAKNKENLLLVQRKLREWEEGGQSRVGGD